MGTYNEPRPPSGAPVDGERDVWLADGKVKFGHWVAASSTWVVDKEIDYTTGDIDGNADTVDGSHAAAFATSGHNHTGTYEPVIGTKGSAFNKDFAGSGSATAVSRSDHAHSGIAGLTHNHYIAWDGDSPTDGWHDIDLSGHVPTGTTAAFIVWMGSGAGTDSTINMADTYTPTKLYGFSGSGSDRLWGSCIVPLDSNYKFRMFVAGTNPTAFYIYVTYVG